VKIRNKKKMNLGYVIIIPKLAKKMYFLGILYATILYYYRGDEADNTASGIKDIPGDSILSHYDFVIVGGGSAGKNNTYYIVIL